MDKDRVLSQLKFLRDETDIVIEEHYGREHTVPNASLKTVSASIQSRFSDIVASLERDDVAGAILRAEDGANEDWVKWIKSM